MRRTITVTFEIDGNEEGEYDAGMANVDTECVLETLSEAWDEGVVVVRGITCDGRVTYFDYDDVDASS